tara:strand:+ start:586 stop:1143 length:558 start_codon:yes stop_codon:yes gene_type:complete
MIDSILFCKDNKSCLIFDGLCKNTLSTKGKPLGSVDFFVDDLSFSVFVGSFVYLFILEFNSKKVDTGMTCEILNKEIGTDFCIEKGRIFMRKSWLEEFGNNTMFSKFNIKKDYVFNCDLIKVNRDVEFIITEKCNLSKYIHSLSKLLKGKYKIRMSGRSIKRRALIFNMNNVDIMDPSLFSLEKI